MKLMILDGNSIVNRAFYGIRMLNAPDGTPTNAVYGFLTIFQRILELEQPQAVCVAFDVHAPTFRHEQYAPYKAQRKPMPEELVVQMPLLKQTLDHMGIRRLELAGWEADDLLGTVAKRCEAAGWACEIVTGDKDSLQLITDTTHVCHVKTRMGQTETIEYTPEVFRAEYGFDPIHMIDLKALMGDSSDNIPGVPGIGEKTAKDLLVRFGTVADIYRDLDTLDIKPGVRKKLTEGCESAQLSFDLATIRTDAPIDFAPESAVWDRDYRPELYDWFRRLGFLKLSEKWGLQPADGAAAPENALPPLPTVDVTDSAALHTLEQAVTAAPYVAVLAPEGLDALTLCDGKACYALAWAQLGDDYNAFLRLLFSDRVRKAGHNIKDLMRALLAEGLPTDGFVFDTALAAYLLDATAGNYDLPRLAQAYLGGEAPDAQTVWALQPVLREKMDTLGMLPLYTDIELPLCPVLARMEHTGFLVDRKALYDFGESLTSAIEQLQQSIWACAGEPFNIQSPKQLGHVLFDQLMLPAGKKTKTGWSTNAAVLEKLRQIENRYSELESKLADPAYYSDPAVFTKLCREQRELQPVVETYRAYTACQAQIAQAEALLSDPELHEIAREEIDLGRARCAELEQQLRVLLLPRDPNDDRNVILEIRTGVGGEESALFAHSLYRMYNMYADAHGWKTEIANLNETELGGVREASLLISGQGAYSRLKFESGVHRVQRVPETETGGRIHTSTATVAVLPEMDAVEVHIDPKDLQIDTYRSSGAGGQHVNKTESAIRITHLPTGTVVECQDERSQYKNKDRAMKILASRLYAAESARQNAARSAARSAPACATSASGPTTSRRGG